MPEKSRQNFILYRNIIAYFKKKEIISTSEEKKQLWDKIVKTVARKKRQKLYQIYISVSSAAAVLAFVAWFSIIGSGGGEKKLDAYVAQMPVPQYSSDILLMVSDKDKIRIDKDTAIVNYSRTGEITVNNQAIGQKKAKKNEELTYSQIIVPGGKRTMLTLSDSTKIWVNAGSRVIFPQKFEGKQRKIFVEGEAYLEVAKNTEKPFIVETSAKFEIKVLGTAFNICTYNGLKYATVVLEEGKIDIEGVNRQKKTMFPNQLVQIDKEGVMGDIIPVDSREYTSWTEGVLVLNSQPFTEVLKRLQIYFGIPIKVDEPIDRAISGELELKATLEKVLGGLQNIVKYDFSLNDNGEYEIKSIKKK